MQPVRQPLTANERHFALRKLERASNIVRHGSLISLPFLPFTACCPLGPIAIVWLAVPIFFFRFIHSYFAEAADDVMNEQPKPLFIALTIAALLTLITLLATISLAFKVAHLDGGVDRWIIMVLPLSLLGFCGWLLRSFIIGWNALTALRAHRSKGFEVVVAKTAGETDSGTPSEVRPTLPPRPRLGPRR